MFRRHTTTNTETTAALDDRPRTVAHRRWYGPTRAFMTLAGGAAGFFLLWLATQVSAASNGGYWGRYGLVAAAALAMAFSQVLGGWTKWGMPRISPTVFLIGFVPLLVAGGWILLAHQPHSGFFRGTIHSWSDGLGLRGLVDDFRDLLPAVAFLVGLAFGFTFDTTGPRTHVVARDVERPAPVTAPPQHEGVASDEPVTAERRTVPPSDNDADGRTVVRTGAARTPPPDDTV